MYSYICAYTYEFLYTIYYHCMDCWFEFLNNIFRNYERTGICINNYCRNILIIFKLTVKLTKKKHFIWSPFCNCLLVGCSYLNRSTCTWIISFFGRTLLYTIPLRFHSPGIRSDSQWSFKWDVVSRKALPWVNLR